MQPHEGQDMKLSVCIRALARRVAVAFSIAGVSAGVIAAGDPVAGAALYINPNGAPLGCAAFSCHGPDPSQNISSIRNGANNPTVIQNAINRNVGGMGFLKPYLSTTDVTNLAAYIANPNAGTAAPAISVSTASLSFGNQVIATRSGTMSFERPNPFA